MFCPACGQRQISDETRFCSACGLQLGALKAILTGAEPPSVQTVQPAAPSRTQRRRDRTFGALLMFLCALFVAALTIDMPASHSARILGLIIAWLTLTLLLNVVPLARYLIYGDEPSRRGAKDAAPRDSADVARPAALPPQQSVPVADFGTQPVNTAEMLPPPSVTERTTNLLGRD